MGESLVERFELESFGVDWYSSLQEAQVGLSTKRFDAVISDIRLPDGSGADLLPLLRKLLGMVPPTIFITGHGSIDQAVSLLKQGATDYLTKPLDIGQLLERLEKLRQDSTGIEPESASRALGVSAVMHDIETKLVRLSGHPNIPVLFYGESGVGKEVAARYLHSLQCPSAPFEALNCAAIPDTLISSELFGHEKGAFTGADKQRPGLFERASDGFAFLDEIGDMRLELQPVLLRLLQERQFTRLGGKSKHNITSRILFATHQDLKQLVKAGQFREDLYYRINVVQIEIPPLRERREDIAWLVERFMYQYNRQNPDRSCALSADARDYLTRQTWPGNVRELQNTIQRACILANNELLQVEDFTLHHDGSSDSASPELNDYLQHGEREYIITTLRKHALRINESAEALGISRKTLWQKMKKYEINRDKL